MITFNVLTIFPEMINSYFKQGILKRAIEQKKIKLNVLDIREYTKDKHRKVDDIPFGGGTGMVMKPEPIFEAVKALKHKKGEKIILTSASGEIFDQKKAKKLAKTKSITIICGRYEGVDERVAEHLTTDEISIGKYILSGGEIAALTIIDAVSRMVPGVVGKRESVENDSFFKEGQIDYPQYTRPAEYQGMEVPKVLLNGNHKEIKRWRQEQISSRKYNP